MSTELEFANTKRELDTFPSIDVFQAHAQAAWAVAEERGGIKSIDVKRHLLALAAEYRLERDEAIIRINRVVPGPADFAEDPATAASVGIGETRISLDLAVENFAQVIPMTTGFEFPHVRIAAIVDVVCGNTVRTRHLGSKIAANVSSNFGGELAGYTKLLDDARNEARARLMSEARRVRADGIIGLRFVISEFFEGSVEVLAYGTAVKFETSLEAD